MPVSITLTFDTHAEAIDALSQLGLAENQEAAGGEAKRGRGRPRKEAAAGEALTAAGSPAAPTASATASAPAASSTPASAPAAAARVDFKTVADLVTELAEKDRDTAVALLKQFGAPKASDLKPEQFGPFVEACRKALAPTPAATSLI